MGLNELRICLADTAQQLVTVSWVYDDNLSQLGLFKKNIVLEKLN